VYVLSLEGDLHSFAPADKKFTKVGPLDCRFGNTTYLPISMAVDRQAVAWVNMRYDGIFATESRIFKVDTKTAECTVVRRFDRRVRSRVRVTDREPTHASSVKR
jgi:hypothetical protein